MNERIKELAAKSNFGHMEKNDVVYDDRLEKFAELIVRECIDVVSQCNLVCVDPIAHIKVHFGVK